MDTEREHHASLRRVGLSQKITMDIPQILLLQLFSREICYLYYYGYFETTPINVYADFWWLDLFGGPSQYRLDFGGRHVIALRIPRGTVGEYAACGSLG